MTREPRPAPPPMPEVLPLGLDGLLIRYGLRFTPEANRAARSLAAALDAQPLPGQVECVSALASALIRFDRDRTSRAEIETALRSRLSAPPPEPAPVGRLWRIPASFGDDNGPQLTEIARIANRSETALVEELCATPLDVLAIGFAPGQPYLGLLPDNWDMPRLKALTPQVPEGAIVTAIRQIVLFANPSPTGWRWLGRCAFRPFQPGSDAPCPLRAEDRVQFVAVDPATLSGIAATGDPMGGAKAETAP